MGDAVANGYLVAVAVRSTGGLLRGIAVWNYNVQHQGLFGDGEPAPYHRGAMFEHLSAAFNDWRAIMVAPGGQTTMLVLMSEGWAQAYLGQTRQAVRGSPLDFGRLLPLARADVPLAVVGALPSLEGIHTVAVLDPTPAYLTPSDLIHLAIFVAGGGRLLATQAVSRALISELQNMWIDRMGRGRVWGLPDDLATLDESGWAQALPGEMVAPEGLLVSTRTWALFYPIDGRAERLPPRRTWRVFGPHGMLFEPIAMVQAHDFALAP